MKKVSQVFILSVVCFNVAFAMEVMPAKKKSDKWFIEFNNDELEYHVGNDVCYGDKYRAQKLHDSNSVLFPVRTSEALAIHHRGNTRYFITSATPENKGRAYIIKDNAIKQMVFVRGIAESTGRGFDLYLGLKTDDYVTYNHGDRIYPAAMMCTLIKARNSRNIDTYQRYVMEKKYIKPFTVDNIKLEIAQNWLRKNIDLKDPVFRVKGSELLGEQAQKFNFEKEKFVLPALGKG